VNLPSVEKMRSGASQDNRSSSLATSSPVPELIDAIEDDDSGFL
jgi:hypothetical protein